MAKKVGNTIGAWAFLIGVILAIILGIIGINFKDATFLSWTLVILGVLIGLLNVTAKESYGFMVAGFILVAVGYMGAGVLSVIEVVRNMLSALLLLFVPATIVVTLRSVFAIAKN